jgi:hypothetical protein
MTMTDPHSNSLQFRVACVLLAQAEQELRNANNPLAKELSMFLEGVLNNLEGK